MYGPAPGAWTGRGWRAGQRQGNFPVALTHLHLALISAAFNLDRALG